MNAKAPLLVVMDGMSYAFRNFYAVPEMTSPQGEPVNALFGFIRAIKRAEKDFKPDYAVVAFDSPGGSFRDEMLKDYKAHREAPPEPLLRQFPLMEEVVPLLGWHLVRKKRFEADDIMATLVAQARKKGMRVVLMTSDKDILQLVGEGVNVYRENPKGASLYGPKEVEERFGVRPDQICDLLGLMGDASDNIPGVPGVGEKTAAKLLQEYGTLEKVLKAAPKITQPKLSANLQEFADTARLSRKLAELDEKVDFDGGLAGMKHGPLQAELADRFRDWGFKSYLAELPKSESPAGAAAAQAEAKSAAKAAQAAKPSKKDPKVHEASGDPKLALKQAGIKPGEACGIWRKGALLALSQSSQALVYRAKDEAGALDLLGLLAEPVFFESKPYQKSRIQAGLEAQAGVRDLSLAVYLINSSRVARNLEEGLAALDIASGPLPQEGEELFEPPALDLARLAKALLQGWQEAEKRLKKDELWKLYADVEEPLLALLCGMELEGLGLDAKVLLELDKQCQKDMKKLEAKALKAAGKDFNLNSPSQLAKVLFEDLKLPHQRKTKTGYSTDNEVLEALAEQHELPALILEYRQLNKLSGTYLRALPPLVGSDGRIHTTWNQCIAATGRLSSTDPNLQNIPIRTELGKEIRRAFVPLRKDGLILAADYSQIELRVLAHYTGDKVLLQAFADNLDIHRETAARIFSVKPEAVSSEMRNRAKVINFGVLYGMGPHRIAREFGVAYGEAKSFVAQYFDRFPKVREFLESCKEDARQKGYVTTILGRRRYVPESRSANRVLREAGDRIATNLPIQGSAADLIKLAMLAVGERLRQKKSKSRLILQVHDELVIDLAKEDKSWLPDELKKIMKNAMKLRCPLDVSVGLGANWHDAKA